MKYTQPEITLINSAVSVIQSIPKQGTMVDSETPKDSSKHVTSAAYDADE